LLSGHAQQGILLCGTGVGMAITANRFPGVYAGLVWNEEIARLAKEDDKVNILVLPADFVSLDQLVAMVKAWQTAQFNEGRYAKRIAMIDE
jgi:ribose 5-phosphate isomerase B